MSESAGNDHIGADGLGFGLQSVADVIAGDILDPDSIDGSAMSFEMLDHPRAGRFGVPTDE